MPVDFEVCKALGDETRFAIYRHLTDSPRGLGVQDLSDALDLHPNTVRLHLERLREVGLVEVAPARRGMVGRPQHVFTVGPDAPGAGADVAAHRTLAAMLALLAERTEVSAADAVAAGYAFGREAARRAGAGSCVRALRAEHEVIGFDLAPHPPADPPEPGADPGPDAATRADPRCERVGIAFARCPFRGLAEAHPDLVCGLHRGFCEGVVDEVGGGRVCEFAALDDADPCRVEVAVG